MSSAYAGDGIRGFFESHWEKLVLWALVIGLFYLLKSFFLLIFETFLITYIAKGMVQWLVARFRFNHRWATVLVFAVFVGCLVAAGTWIGPKLVVETSETLAEFRASGEKQLREKVAGLVEYMDTQSIGGKKLKTLMSSEEYTQLRDAIKTQLSQATAKNLPRIMDIVLAILKWSWTIIFSLFLAVVFSFILVFDWEKIRSAMKMLEHSRIRAFYMNTAPHFAAFANILGRALRAQAITALFNAVFTALGLWFFKVPNVALLAAIVFLCSFIPILGTFISSVPILIFGLQAGGPALALKLIGLVAVVHAVEAYGFSPRITSTFLRIHPIMVLILLLLGERFFGLWGMVVGVPIGYYVLSLLIQTDTEAAGAPPAVGQDKPVQPSV